jgi:hypothetical protein
MSVTTTVLDAALEYARSGWAVFPAPPGKKKSYKAAKFSSGQNWGKTKSAEEIKRDFARWPDANVGIPTGVENNIFVVEADTPEGHEVDGIAALKELEAEHGKLPDTLMAISPTGSLHHFFNHPGGGVKIKNSASEIAPGIDVRGEGGMVIAPPSVKPGVGAYRWLNNLPIADAPSWLVALVTANDDGERQPGAEPEADPARVAAALAVMPNADIGWDEWNRIGMAVWRATGGRGFAEFDAWSQKSAKYDANNTAEKWAKFFESPPNQIGAGTLFWLASAAAEAGLEAAANDPEIHAKIIAELGEQPNAEQPKANGKRRLLLSSAEFVNGFVPPDYLVDGMLLRKNVYALTGRTGDGKTAVALRIAAHVACGLPLAERTVEKGACCTSPARTPTTFARAGSRCARI